MSKHTVYRVDDVTAALLESDPPKLNVTAQGTVPTQGWSNPELTPYVYVMPPLDGIQDFGFIAEPPIGIVPQVLTPITASYTMDSPPSWLLGVRVHASTNAKEAFLGGARPRDGKICVKGTLTDEGVECQALRTEAGELYTLVGDLHGFKDGDKVYLLGTIVPISFCMQGITIAIEWISKDAPKCR